MKTKKFNKKLVLKKNTVANLDGKTMATVKGGGTNTICIAPLSLCVCMTEPPIC